MTRADARPSAVSFFFEEKAFDERGNLQQDKATSINKVGHGEHSVPLTAGMQHCTSSRPLMNNHVYIVLRALPA